MSQLTCGGCGSVYALAGVQALDTFQCSTCQRVIVVPIAGPSASRAAQANTAPPRAAPPPAPAPRPAQRAAPVVRRAPEPPPIPAGAPTRAAAEREREGDPSLMKPLRGLGDGVTAMFIVLVLAAFADVWYRWSTIEFIDGIRPGVAPDMELARRLDASTTTAVLAHLAAMGVLAIVFCTWFHRAHSNLRAAKLPKMEYGSGWTIGGFLVPVLNLVRPAQLMRETWAGTSYLSGTSKVSSWKRSPSNPLVGWWWGLFLAASVVGYAALFSSGGAGGGVSAVKTAYWLWIAARVVEVASVLAGIALVRRISELQEWARRRE